MPTLREKIKEKVGDIPYIVNTLTKDVGRVAKSIGIKKIVASPLIASLLLAGALQINSCSKRPKDYYTIDEVIEKVEHEKGIDIPQKLEWALEDYYGLSAVKDHTTKDETINKKYVKQIEEEIKIKKFDVNGEKEKVVMLGKLLNEYAFVDNTNNTFGNTNNISDVTKVYDGDKEVILAKSKRYNTNNPFMQEEIVVDEKGNKWFGGTHEGINLGNVFAEGQAGLKPIAEAVVYDSPYAVIVDKKGHYLYASKNSIEKAIKLENNKYLVTSKFEWGSEDGQHKFFTVKLGRETLYSGKAESVKYRFNKQHNVQGAYIINNKGEKVYKALPRD